MSDSVDLLYTDIIECKGDSLLHLRPLIFYARIYEKEHILKHLELNIDKLDSFKLTFNELLQWKDKES